MSRWTRIGAAAGGVAAAGALALAAGGLAWRRATSRAVAELEAHATARAAARATARATAGPPAGGALAALPAPVARHLALVLPDARAPGGPGRVRGARVRWRGEFQLAPGAGWRPFTAEQHFTVDPPGFVWDAAIELLPAAGALVPARVRDRYVGGEGGMLGRLGGLVPLVDAAGTPELAASALARWLGEAAWLPGALLPGAGVTWEAVDDSTARATVHDGAVRVRADFHFAPTGEMTRMTALRHRDVNGRGVLTPFEGRYGAYVRLGGVLVPGESEVAWLLPEGRFPYWRGRPVEVVLTSDPAPSATRR